MVKGDTGIAEVQKRESTPQSTDTSNPELAQIYEDDQKPRHADSIDWNAVNVADEERRIRVRALLKDNKLQTGEDFERAAFIFQHSHESDDYLLAHTLAMVAVARGQPSAIWIAAATLDRYLQSAGKPQIFGTQYQTMDEQPATQEPYNRSLIADALRSALKVPPIAAQEERRKQIDTDRQLPSSTPKQ